MKKNYFILLFFGLLFNRPDYFYAQTKSQTPVQSTSQSKSQASSSTKSSSDNITSAQTLAYINEKYKGICELKENRGDLVVVFFKNGAPIRQDIVPFEQINPTTVGYIASENAIVIRCLADDKCIQRKNLQSHAKDYFARMIFPLELNPNQQKSMIKAFTHLIMLFHDPGYKSNEPFE